eukprot:gene11013-12835_t
MVPCGDTVCLECFNKSDRKRCLKCGELVQAKYWNKQVAGLSDETKGVTAILVVQCRQHHRDYFTSCLDCKSPVCTDCVIDQRHRGHIFENVSRLQFDEGLKSFGKDWESHRSSVGKVNRDLAQGKSALVAIEARKSRDVSAIKVAFQSIKNVVEATEKRLLDKELEGMYDQAQFQLSEATKRIEALMTPLNSRAEFNQLTSGKTDEELATTYHMVILDHIATYNRSIDEIKSLQSAYKSLISTAPSFQSYDSDIFESSVKSIQNTLSLFSLKETHPSIQIYVLDYRRKYQPGMEMIRATLNMKVSLTVQDIVDRFAKSMGSSADTIALFKDDSELKEDQTLSCANIKDGDTLKAWRKKTQMKDLDKKLVKNLTDFYMYRNSE